MKYRNESGLPFNKKGVVFKVGEVRDLTTDEVRKLGTPFPEELVLVKDPQIPERDPEPKPKPAEPVPSPPVGPAPVVLPNAQGQAIAFRR